MIMMKMMITITIMRSMIHSIVIKENNDSKIFSTKKDIHPHMSCQCFNCKKEEIEETNNNNNNNNEAMDEDGPNFYSPTYGN
mmetsp:Transcript_31325/g.33655  ORF Transcript_31325/g.33655 Transcript_31325/m.33655 type:complete len:82 (+) Transcript_31325:202-447(+)